jgi:hypothetical protein
MSPFHQASVKIAGLFTVALPLGVMQGEEFNIIVRRIASRKIATDEFEISVPRVINWRYVTGTFSIRIPVTTGPKILRSEEDTLAIMKWRLQQMLPGNRWYLVLLRYISLLSGRVSGLGGNVGSIPPSPTGAGPVPPGMPGGPFPGSGQEYTGKVIGLIYDRFGDFEGFLLMTDGGKEKKFRNKEKNIESLIRFAWEKRIVISVISESSAPQWAISIILRNI